MQTDSPIDWQRWADTLVTEERFAQRREPLLNHATYTKRSRRKLADVSRMTKNLAKRHASRSRDIMMAPQQRLWDILDWLCLQYSAGAPAELFADVWPHVLTWAEESVRLQTEHQGTKDDYGYYFEPDYDFPPRVALTNSEYWMVALRLVCFGLLSGHAERMPRVMDVLDFANEDCGIRDGLIERLVAPFVSGRGTPPEHATRILPYRNLLPVFTTPPEQRPARMAEYLQGWYRTCRHEPFFGQHDAPEGTFCGYWSWEAGAVTWLFDIDDASYRDMSCYPRDLVDFARRFPRTPDISPKPFPLVANLRKPAQSPSDNSDDLPGEPPSMSGPDRAPGYVWNLLTLINPGHPRLARQQFAAWSHMIDMETCPYKYIYPDEFEDEDEDILGSVVSMMEVIDWQSGFFADRQDTPPFINAINALTERWDLRIDWIGTLSDEEFLDLGIPELIDIASRQLRASGYSLWTWRTAVNDYAGWITRSCDDESMRKLLKEEDINLSPENHRD